MKIIGSDYDGTLNHGGIDEKKIDAIARWRKAGNIFAVVTGRGVVDATRLYREQQFECDYLLADNGAVIMLPDGEIVSDVRCDGSLAKPLLQLLFENGCPWGHVQTDFPCRVYADVDDCTVKGEYSADNIPEISFFYQINTALPDFETAAKVTNIIKEKMGAYFNPLQNGSCIDIVRADVNKAQGLYMLMDLLGVGYDDVIAVGDNINDRDMIAEFRSYAMANGVDSIKELADYITTGITELIDKELEE